MAAQPGTHHGTTSLGVRAVLRVQPASQSQGLLWRDGREVALGLGLQSYRGSQRVGSSAEEHTLPQLPSPPLMNAGANAPNPLTRFQCDRSDTGWVLLDS